MVHQNNNNKLYLALLAVRSLLFFIGFWASVGVFGVLTIVCFFLPVQYRRQIASCMNVTTLAWLQLTCGVRFQAHGLENIPNEPAVYLSNHQSTGETFYLQRLLLPTATLVKKELLYLPFFGWGLYLTKPIIIDRGSPKEALKRVLEQGKQQLESGSNVILYPQGTRVPYGKKVPFARSGAALAIHAKAAVVPVAHNAGAYWPKQFIKYPGTIHVHFGTPIKDATNSKELTDQVQTWIEDKMDELDRAS